MITEDYCSYEVYKLLKEKGFNYKGFDYIDFEGEVITQDRPTHQMAMKWLREVHKIEIWVHYDIDKTTWWGGCNPMYEEDEENSNMFQSLLGFDYPGKTYEEACEAALKYCLENLIL